MRWQGAHPPLFREISGGLAQLAPALGYLFPAATSDGPNSRPRRKWRQRRSSFIPNLNPAGPYFKGPGANWRYHVGPPPATTPRPKPAPPNPKGPGAIEAIRQQPSVQLLRPMFDPQETRTVGAKRFGHGNCSKSEIALFSPSPISPPRKSRPRTEIGRCFWLFSGSANPGRIHRRRVPI